MIHRIEKVLILNKYPFRESDLVVKSLSHSGWVHFVAPAGQKSRKRFGGILEPTHFLKVSLHKTKEEQELWRVSEAQLLEDFAGLKSSYQRLEKALKINSFILQLPELGPDKHSLFMLLGRSLRALEKATPQELDSVYWSFFARYLLLEGYLPQESPVRHWIDGQDQASIPMAVVLTSQVKNEIRERIKELVPFKLDTI